METPPPANYWVGGIPQRKLAWNGGGDRIICNFTLFQDYRMTVDMDVKRHLPFSWCTIPVIVQRLGAGADIAAQ